MSGYIYADHAATTFLSPAALEAMLPFMTGQNYGNPSSIHSFGEAAAAAVAEARSTIAEVLNCLPEEVIFTSGGSEADNQAMLILENSARESGKAVLVADLSGFGEAPVPKRWYAYQGQSVDGAAVMLKQLVLNLTFTTSWDNTAEIIFAKINGAVFIFAFFR